MPDLGFEVLFKGTNFLRLLGGLWVAVRISLISVVISMPLGIVMGILMTMKNPILKAVLRVYLEFIRIMPQLVLLFIVFFGTTRWFGLNISGEIAAIIVFPYGERLRWETLYEARSFPFQSTSMRAVKLWG